MRPRTGDEGVANTSGGEAPLLHFALARRAENAKHVHAKRARRSIERRLQSVLTNVAVPNGYDISETALVPRELIPDSRARSRLELTSRRLPPTLPNCNVNFIVDSFSTAYYRQQTRVAPQNLAICDHPRLPMDYSEPHHLPLNR
jgi:hypothetical protein